MLWKRPSLSQGHAAGSAGGLHPSNSAQVISLRPRKMNHAAPPRRFPRAGRRWSHGEGEAALARLCVSVSVREPVCLCVCVCLRARSQPALAPLLSLNESLNEPA